VALLLQAPPPRLRNLPNGQDLPSGRNVPNGRNMAEHG